MAPTVPPWLATMCRSRTRAQSRANDGNRGHQRVSTSGPAEGGGLCIDGGCAAGDGVLGCWGLCCGTATACCDWTGDDMVCLMSSSTACSFAMFWAIWSCLAASSSTPRRTASRLDVKGKSCCTESGEVTAAAGAAVETDSNQASVGARATTICLAASLTASPRDCQASVPPTPIRTAIRNRVTARNIRLPTDGRSLAARSVPKLEARGESIDGLVGL